MPEIIFLMGKSATGKDHIYEQLAHDEQLHLKRITMYTTRPMRAGEAEGVEYHFVNDDEAARLEKEGKIIEMRCYDTVIGVWKYFTVNDGQIQLGGKNRYIVIGTLEAYDGFCKYYGKEHLLPIYIEVEDKTGFCVLFTGKKNRKSQSMRNCAVGFWQMSRIFPKKI